MNIKDRYQATQHLLEFTRATVQVLAELEKAPDSTIRHDLAVARKSFEANAEELDKHCNALARMTMESAGLSKPRGNFLQVIRDSFKSQRR